MFGEHRDAILTGLGRCEPLCGCLTVTRACDHLDMGQGISSKYLGSAASKKRRKSQKRKPTASTEQGRFVVDSRSKDGRTPLHREGFSGQTLCGKPVYADSESLSRRPAQSRACRDCETKELARLASFPASVAKAKRDSRMNELPKCRKCGKRIKGGVSTSRICYPCRVPVRIVSGGAPGSGARVDGVRPPVVTGTSTLKASADAAATEGTAGVG